MDFSKVVLERSIEVPVLVDFWAPWCGPCRTLGPDIEALAAEANGRWELVKVNTDEQPELMQQFKIRGIPAVKLFNKGEVVAEFTGALPKYQIEQWLEEHLPDARKEEMNNLIRSEDEKGLSAFVERHPDLIDARIALSKLLLFKDPARSLSLMSGVKIPIKVLDESDQIKQLANFLTFNFDDDLAIEEKLREAQKEALAENHEVSVKLLIDAVMMNKNYKEDLPRKSCIAYFQCLGTDHSVTKTFRRRFDMALY